MYFPLRIHSHYSLLMSTLKPEDISEVCKKNKYKAAGLTDFTSVSGCAAFQKECKKLGIKSILGCELLITDNPDRQASTITLLAKNKSGWNTLLNIISICNESENFKKYPTIKLDDLKKFDLSDFICIDGYVNSLFHYSIFSDVKSSYFIQDYDELAESCLDRRWEEKAAIYVAEMQKIFPDYYLECTTPDCCSDINPLPLLITNCIKSISDLFKVKCVVDNPVYYQNNTGSIDHRVLLCSKLKCVMSSLSTKISNGGLLENQLNIFLKSTYFKFNDIPQSTHEEIYNKCEDYNILSQPKLPKYDCGQLSELEALKSLCRIGWKSVLEESGVLINQETKNIYRDRVLQELEVIEKAQLAGYFLIVQDYVNEFRNKGYLIGPGRGSVGGSLIAYLTGITLVDPIVYDLLFSRFYDSSRVVAGKISLPDIDVDFPPEIREEVIAYLKTKYGPDKVAQIATYGRLQGKSALKEVLRINEYCSFEQMNNITSCLPNEGAISDQLEEMEEPSIIMWALEHEADKLRDYCFIKDNELHGEYSKAFSQAIRLEGINKNLGKHAAAVIISSERLDNFCPMIRANASSEKYIGYDMYSVEDVGGVKVDILGLSALTVIQRTCED